MIESIGVPKHSDLEPHHLLVKGNGKRAAKSRLTRYMLVKSYSALTYHLSHRGLELKAR